MPNLPHRCVLCCAVLVFLCGPFMGCQKQQATTSDASPDQPATPANVVVPDDTAQQSPPSQMASLDNTILQLTKAGLTVAVVKEEPLPRNTLHVTVDQNHLTTDGLINGATLDLLKQVESMVLSLHATTFTDTGLVAIRDLPGLIGLDLDKTRITDAGLLAIKDLTKLQMLKISETVVSDDGLKLLTDLSQLSTLNLSGTRITDAGMAYLVHFSQLRALRLSNLPITDAGAAHIGQLTNMMFLGLDSTLVSDGVLQHLSGLKRLKILDLRRTGVTNEFVVSFRTTHPECQVAL